MLTTTHKLSAQEAHDIKKALLAAASSTACATGFADPASLARGLIEAFRLVDEATQQAPSSASSEA